MARYLPAELDQIFRSPRTTGWKWSNLAPDPDAQALDWIGGIAPGDDIGRVIAERSIDSAGLISSFGTAELLRGLAVNPSIGIQESKAGLLARMQDLADDNFTLPNPEGVDPSWLKALDVDMSSFVRFEGGRVRIDSGELAGALGNIAIDRLATVAIGATSAIPFVGWLVSSLLAVGKMVARKRSMMAALSDEQEKWEGVALTSQFCRIPSPDTPGGAAWIATADQQLAAKVIENTADPDRDYADPGTVASAEAGPGADLTFAMMPHVIPSGFRGNGQGGYLVGEQDQDCSSSGSDARASSAFAGRLVGSLVGSGYLPGFGMVGRPLFTARNGLVYENQNYAFAAGLFERSDIGDSLSGTASLCRTIEGMTLRAPWCYQVQTWRIREAWKKSIEGWGELEGSSWDDLPSKNVDALPLYGRALVSPAPWLYMSRVKVKTSGGALISALRQGPELLGPKGWQVEGWPVGDAVSLGNCQGGGPEPLKVNRTNQDPVGVAWRRQMLEIMFGFREGSDLDFNMWTRVPGSSWWSEWQQGQHQARIDMFAGERDLPMWWPKQYEKAPSAVGEWYHDPKWYDVTPRGWGAGGVDDPALDGVRAIPNPYWPSCSDMHLYKPQDFGEWRSESERLGRGAPEDPIFWKDRSRTFSASSTATVKTWGPMGMCVEPYLARVEKKQWDALDTLQCAYVSHSAPAFEEGTPGVFLRARLIERRTQLLQHSARFEVHLADVVDSVDNEPPNILSNYRAMLKASGVGKFGPGGPQLAPGTPGEPEAWKGPADFEIEIPDPSPPGPGGPGSITVDVYQPPPPEDDPEQEQEEAPPLPVPMGGSEIASKPDETIPEVESDEERRAGLLVPVAIAAGALALTRKG